MRDGPVDDGQTAVDGHRLVSGTVVDGRWIIEIGLEERAAERWACPRRCPGIPRRRSEMSTTTLGCPPNRPGYPHVEAAAGLRLPPALGPKAT